MLKKILFCIITIFSIQTVAQTRDIQVEISTRIFVLGQFDEFKFEIEPIGTAYCNNAGSFYIDTGAGKTEEHVTGTNSGNSYGFDVCFTDDPWEDFWVAFNKITISYKGYDVWEYQTHFYIDYRDSQYGGSGCSSNDIAILWNDIAGVAYVAPGLSYNYSAVDTGQILRYATIDSCTNPSTAGLPNF